MANVLLERAMAFPQPVTIFPDVHSSHVLLTGSSPSTSVAHSLHLHFVQLACSAAGAAVGRLRFMALGDELHQASRGLYESGLSVEQDPNSCSIVFNPKP